MYAGTRFEPLIAEGFELRRMVVRQTEMTGSGTSGEMQAANRNAISARGFDLVARRMAALMCDKFDIAFIDVGGWDTHVNQGGAQGQLADRLGNLGRGLATFAQGMGPAWNDTVVVVMSEFGRTFRENGTGGTDHGHGTVYWVLGGAVRGGRIVGDQVAVGRSTLKRGSGLAGVDRVSLPVWRPLQAPVRARRGPAGRYPACAPRTSGSV
jgi:uncharacterized protein (DUF1501 family)